MGGVNRLIDSYLQLRFGLWNALITINGIYLAALALAPAGNASAGLKTAICLICFVSLVILFYMYLASKNAYLRMAKVNSQSSEAKDSEKSEKETSLSFQIQGYVGVCESLCFVGLLISSVLLSFYILGKS